MRACWMGIGMGLGLLSCGGGNSGAEHVEISGKTPAEAAAVAARAVCGHDARCGHVSITCTGGGSAGGNGSDASAPISTCVATIQPIPYSDCYADASDDIADLLTCAAPTPEQTNMLEICFDMLAARNCVTQAEADAQARAIAAGAEPPPDDRPAACALLASTPPGC